jgi:hypothetical protein
MDRYVIPVKRGPSQQNATVVFACAAMPSCIAMVTGRTLPAFQRMPVIRDLLLRIS